MGDEIVLATTSIVIEAVPGDDAEDLAEAALAAKRLACLEKLRAIAIAASEPVSRATAEASISRLRRGRAGRSKKENAVLRRHTAKAQKAEHEKLLHKRGVQQEANRDRAELANVLAVQRAAKAKDMAGKKGARRQDKGIAQDFLSRAVWHQRQEWGRCQNSLLGAA